jgi:hypothetical protein
MIKFALILLLFPFSGPVLAGLGAAVTEAPDSIKAWCGKPLNNCTITFQDGRMKVDGNEGILPSQIRLTNTNRTFRMTWWPPAARDSNGFRWDYEVTYEEDGKKMIAVFMFVNEEGASALERALQRFVPTLRPIGPSIRIEKEDK